MELQVLLISALTLGVVHTVLGPDHYLPFVAMSRAGGWSQRKTFWVTSLCGVGHVLGSVALGMLGVLVGLSVSRLEVFEAARGNVAGWMLLAFGGAFFVWGIHRAIRNRPHTHVHAHTDGSVHAHEHTHARSHVHAHTSASGSKRSLTPWILFTIFLFGPCEVLIPLLMYPAARGNLFDVALVSLTFGAATVITMTAIVMVASAGVSWFKWGPLMSRYGEAVAGCVIMLSGLAVVLGF